MNGADTPAFVPIRSSDPDVAIFAPSSAPGVSDNVKVLTLGRGAITDSVDNVVHFGTTFWRVNDSSLVIFEGSQIGCHIHGRNSLLNSCLLLGPTSSSRFERLDLGKTLGFQVLIAFSSLEVVTRSVFVD